jgi:hypothetical protein
MNAMTKLVIGLLLAAVTFAGSACAIVPLYPGYGYDGGGHHHHRHGGW